MYGTTLSNAQIEILRQVGGEKGLTITHFNKANLKLSHYRLQPGLLYRPVRQGSRGDWERELIHDFDEGPYAFDGNEYLIIAPREEITLPEGVVAQVIPASTLVEQCFSLTAGKLDAGYSETGAKFLMGIKNLRSETNKFHPERGLANVSFVDFRGADRNRVSFTANERRDYEDRTPV